MADKDDTDTDFFDNPKKFEEQCFFMDNLDFFVADLEKQGYLNFVKMQMGPKQDTSAFFNKITVPKGLDKFLNITPAQAATLVPYIKLYKVFYPNENSQGADYEIIFENYITGDALKEITSSRTGRGAGAGIKSFSWENKGETQATANRIFEAKLELYFQDFDALNTTQTAVSPDGNSSRKVRFLDLVVPEGQAGANFNEWNKDYFRIKVAIGWSVPNQKLSNSGVSFSQDERGAIERAGKVFFLNLLSHELSFNPDGQINLSISYVGGTESVIASPDADVLALDINSPEVKKVEKAKKKLEKTRKIKKLNSDQECGTKKERESRTENIETAEKEDVEKFKEAQKEANLQRYLNFTNYLYSRLGAMRYIDIPTEKLDEYIKNRGEDSSDIGARSLSADFLSETKKGSINLVAGADAIQKAARAASGGDDKAAEAAAESIGGERADAQRMIYTSFGNVLEAALYAINKDSSRREIRTIAGMISVPNPLTGKNKVVNIADLPVSYKMFSTWFYNVCISKNLKQWRFKKFLHQASQNLFRSVIKAKCFDDDEISGLGDLDLKIETLDLPRRSDDGDAIFPSIRGAGNVSFWNAYDTNINPPLVYEPKKIEDIDDPTENYNSQDTNINSYLLIYGKQTNPSMFHHSTGEREIEDRKKKVYHFRVGKNQGLVKNINFSRVDIPYAKEARLIAAKNENSKILALREVYDVNITLYGNTIWSPGSLIYVDISSQFGNDLGLAEKMGLQAYYRIINTSSFIENGKYETTIVGKYEFSGNREIDNREASEGAEECASLNDPKYNTIPPPRAEGPVNRGFDGTTTNK